MTHLRNRAAVSWVFLMASGVCFQAVFCQATATAQSTEYHQPLHEKLPPGFTADTLARVRQYDPMWLQPVRVELPSGGVVSVYSANPEPLATIAAPAQFSVNAGHLYRLRISEMPEFPGVEIFPSIEILDRLHPPHGTEANYPIPVVLTQADLREAVEGALVTRVIYLEHPRLAASVDPLRREFPQTVAPTQNALQEADQMGRAMIIVRIGGRIPSGPNMPLSYFGTGGAFDLGESLPVNAGVVTLSDKPKAMRALVNRGR
jgi:hypothetical protein